MTIKIKNEELAEFVGQIIDIFEDFLEEKDVEIENEERDDDPDGAIIYGSDYGAIQEQLEELFSNWS